MLSGPSHFLEKEESADMKAILEEHIRQRAYRLYEERGSENGHALVDWLQAEREARGGASRKGEIEEEPRHTGSDGAAEEERRLFLDTASSPGVRRRKRTHRCIER